MASSKRSLGRELRGGPRGWKARDGPPHERNVAPPPSISGIWGAQRSPSPSWAWPGGHWGSGGARPWSMGIADQGSRVSFDTTASNTGRRKTGARSSSNEKGESLLHFACRPNPGLGVHAVFCSVFWVFLIARDLSLNPFKPHGRLDQRTLARGNMVEEWGLF
ncbi:hypothetical protein GWK47_049768 [Chionoecetes opilio]|uniref:Uncharacterized protein n=1 Tax=Chionoecetes opilio TaxID=41210 RepID=A0A8J4Y2C1_CHIOP|nr:hypothetical protein GWK47_049768 [Chionoecetes opilio]